MSDKVSVIIPNYNGELYMKACFDSVLYQTYTNMEIIVIDDGSTDNSWEIINQYKQKYNSITAIRQSNMGASIARNRGIDLATGRYVFFLDSDDVLCQDALMQLINEQKKSNADLVIGNTLLINEDGVIIGRNDAYEKDIENCLDWCGSYPAPSNKIYLLEVMKEHNIYFGNVRIGQDLNFFIKYLLFCSKVNYISYDIYQWRQVKTSISHTYTFKIFDIAESFMNIKNFFKINGFTEEYNKYVTIIEYRHYYFQMKKQKHFKKKAERKLVVNYFENLMKKLDIKKCTNYVKYKTEVEHCKIKLTFKYIYYSRLYYFLVNK
jgi:glycosyltransferase involved in cell wall biosynthesis